MEEEIMKVVLIYSGGLDSTVLLTKLVKEKHEVIALNFYYGSKHGMREREAARKICALFNLALPLPQIDVKFVEINLGFVNKHFKSNLLQSGGKIPEDHYTEASMKKTVVPFRNGIMLSIAAGYAESIGATLLLLASHAGDYTTYPDCRPKFNAAIAQAINEGTDGKVILNIPFQLMTKADVVELGVNLKAPFKHTYSCYNGREKHCGLCGTCKERIEAFKRNKLIDPVEYEIDVDWSECTELNY